MNSMYGKTILKPIETETIVRRDFEFNKYVSYNYNFIQSAIQVGDRYYIKRIKSILNQYNYVHCGVEILSMSKRIMNEVMTLAEDENLNIWYQDTDSMHINLEHVDKLSVAFREKYNRELIGSDMGMFHVDHDSDGACGDICATESYFIGKKVYIDKLESVDKNGETITDDHIRLKSVPTSCVKYTADTYEIDPMELYKQLYNGTKILFDLTESGKNCGFKFEKNLSIRSYEESEFVRGISFSQEIERIEIH